MRKPNWNLKALYHGTCTLISNAWFVISIVVLDQVQKVGTGILTQTSYGIVNSNGAPSDDMKDQPLSRAFILDTKEDVYTTMLVTCHGCGNELEVVSVQEKPEVAIILSVDVCVNCKNIAHHAGYHKGSSDTIQEF